MTVLTSHDLGPAVPRRGNRFTRWLGRRVLAAIGLKVTGELPNFPKMMVIGAPHTSNWDGVMAIGMALALSIDVRVVAKQALFRWPFAGLLRWMGVIGIDRNAAGGVVGELTQLYNDADQLYICMSPEGTRGGATTWKTGFHRIALAAEVPVLVLVFDWGRGRIDVADWFQPSEDIEADLDRVLSNYHGVLARNPSRLSGPIKALADQPDSAPVDRAA